MIAAHFVEVQDFDAWRPGEKGNPSAHLPILVDSFSNTVIMAEASSRESEPQALDRSNGLRDGPSRLCACNPAGFSRLDKDASSADGLRKPFCFTDAA
jgi:hypothetical protein